MAKECKHEDGNLNPWAVFSDGENRCWLIFSCVECDEQIAIEGSLLNGD